MKILIIEDDPGLRSTLQELLEAGGHEVLAAEDGVQGLALAVQSPEFIFCDVNMPNLDGPGVLAAIKQMPGVCEVPFVFLTARDKRSELREGMSLGADDYITKPYTSADIFGAIAARTKRQRNLREQIQALTERQQREIHAQWSHELLTPLNAVLGSLDLIEGEVDTISRTELKELLALIRDGATRQERLSRKLIHYFSLEQLANSPTPASPGGCTAEVAIAAGASRGARLRNREADLVVAVEPAEVALQEQWLVLAIGEIVENAAIFSPAGTTIEVSGARIGATYRVVVLDQGPGLSDEQRAKVGAFVQFDRKSREQQGLGLGLSIARLAARFAGGELILKPGPTGRGLQAEFNLPMAKTA